MVGILCKDAVSHFKIKNLLYKSLEMTFPNVAIGINKSMFLELQRKVIFILSVFMDESFK